jgi:hypothetical protein
MRNLPLVGNRLPSLSMLAPADQRKYLYAWFQSRRKDYLLDHAIPWITYDATEFLKANLSKGIRVFEYGSGASTLFWALYQAHCVSIEHDPVWYELLRVRFDPSYDVDLRLVPADPPAAQIADADIADPENYRTSSIGFEDRTFRNYVSQIDAFPDGYFDVVMVDGQARPSCVAHSYKKVKRNGMLILDNADVPQYLARAAQYLEDFELHGFRGIAPIQGVLSQTNIYIAR